MEFVLGYIFGMVVACLFYEAVIKANGWGK